MRILKGVACLIATLAVVSFVTAILWYAKLTGIGPHHPVFFYLLPIALVALVFGILPGMFCASAAIVCAAYFLYDPIYSFHVAKTLELGDLVCFAILAAITVKCAVELWRPVAIVPRSRYAPFLDGVSALRIATPTDPIP